MLALNPLNRNLFKVKDGNGKEVNCQYCEAFIHFSSLKPGKKVSQILEMY